MKSENEIDPRDNPPTGYKYDCFATPYAISPSIVTWYDGLGETIDVKGCLLMPREVDTDGTCYLFRKVLTDTPVEGDRHDCNNCKEVFCDRLHKEQCGSNFSLWKPFHPAPVDSNICVHGVNVKEKCPECEKIANTPVANNNGEGFVSMYQFKKQMLDWKTELVALEKRVADLESDEFSIKAVTKLADTIDLISNRITALESHKDLLPLLQDLVLSVNQLQRIAKELIKDDRIRALINEYSVEIYLEELKTKLESQ
jgi:hypothetical protein